MAIDERSRYKYSVIIKEGDTFYIGGTDPLTVRSNSDDIEHVWMQGDRLDILAQKYYGDARLWWIIAEYNNIMHFFEEIEYGRVLILPSLTRVVLNIL